MSEERSSSELRSAEEGYGSMRPMPHYPESMLRGPSAADAATLDALVREAARLQVEVETTEVELDGARGAAERTRAARKRLGDARRRLERLLQRDVPDQMLYQMKGTMQHTTSDGCVVQLVVAPKIKHLAAGKREELLKWLEANGHDAVAAQLREARADAGRAVLGRFVRRQLESGNEFPRELFGVSRTHVAKLTRPRRSA